MAQDTSMITLDEGRLDDVIIQFETIEDNFEKAIVKYDYPFADGADLEDMGQKAHSIRFRCWFWDDADYNDYEDHTLLLDSLSDKNLLDFEHPKYGLMKGKIERINIKHDDLQRAVAIDLDFVEQMRGEIAIQPAQSVQTAVEKSYISTQVAQESLLSQMIAAIIPPADLAVLNAAFDSGQGLLAQVQGYSNTTRLLVSGIESRLSAAEAVVSQIVSPANSLQATMTYSATLPGRILGMLGTTLEKYGLLYSSLINYPSLYISRVNQALDNLADSFDTFSKKSSSTIGTQSGIIMSQQLQYSSAQRLALEAADIYAADTDAASGKNDDVEPMTVNELESTLAVVRTRLESAIESARDLDGLKAMAAALLTQVNTVRLEREKMVSVLIENPLPLHLVCLKYGMPYIDAERLIKVNNIPQPNYTSGAMQVYVR